MSRETHEVITTLNNDFWFRLLPGTLPKFWPREATKTEQRSQRVERREQKRSVYVEVAEMCWQGFGAEGAALRGKPTELHGDPFETLV